MTGSAYTLILSDDPANASGLSAPAIVRGTVYAHLAAGVTVGTGNSGTVRTATGTALQAAINYAVTNNKFFEIEPNIYEINNSAGLVVPYSNSGMNWHGSTSSYIAQYATNAPILTLGDTTGANINYRMVLNGVGMYYGVTQAGQTSAIALQMGPHAWCNFSNVVISPYAPGGTFNAYIGMKHYTGSFSGNFDNFYIEAGQLHIVQMAGSSSGNVWNNTYCAAGTLNNPTALSGYAFGWDNGTTNTVFNQLNIEAVAANQIMNVAQCYSTTFNSVHMESITMTGSTPIIWAGNSAYCVINGCTLDFICTSAGGASGYGRFLGTFTTDNWVMNNIVLLSNSTDSGAVNLTFMVVDAQITPDTPANVVMSGFTIRDATSAGLSTHVQLDAHTPLANFNTPLSVANYRFGLGGSVIEGAVIPVTATYTHYGQHVDAVIEVPAAITGFTLTLSAVQGATGNQPVKTGNTVHVRRQIGTASGTLLVKDDAGTTLTTNTTSAQDFYYYFNGTHYVTFTPVT